MISVKKAKVIAIAAFLVIFLGIGSFLAMVLLEDDMKPPKLPINSEKNNLILTSNGCCFFVQNVRVSLDGENGESLVLSEEKGVYEYDILKHEIPNFSASPLKLSVSFEAFYGETAEFSLSVMEFENIEELKKSGVLLYFQEHDDMYLNVVIGDYRASYKMGNEHNRWTVKNPPNKLYSGK